MNLFYNLRSTKGYKSSYPFYISISYPFYTVFKIINVIFSYCHFFVIQTYFIYTISKEVWKYHKLVFLSFYYFRPFLDTYVGKRIRRSISSDELINMMEAEKRLVAELGENVCIYPKVCLYHAGKARRFNGKHEMVIDWDEIFRWVGWNDKEKNLYISQFHFKKAYSQIKY